MVNGNCKRCTPSYPMMIIIILIICIKLSTARPRPVDALRHAREYLQHLITCAYYDDDDGPSSCVHWPHLNNDKNRRAVADNIYDLLQPLQVQRTRGTRLRCGGACPADRVRSIYCRRHRFTMFDAIFIAFKWVGPIHVIYTRPSCSLRPYNTVIIIIISHNIICCVR